ncbi:tyrosine-protein phosphatase non-receptor type 14 [Octopus bimaculoides]|uniref:protein-tyrosine-phosphatase n=1 Tax=Octopus bimaculoides TaxID=37653 RepID=A0A0L8GRT9_OCTBM|nr:tyrosine-protein phosphatase non-receptor type 14 [Octopus bimaculoides]|eukprot:XP_014778688.1 PREDICTED: tyrosine-protein phosphatase non-receptor type 14-like [Octopus bimaculoides]
MPFNFKLKRTKRYEVSSKYEFVVGVHMLDNSYLECSLKADSTGHDCLGTIAHMLKLEEFEYFGFRYVTKKLQFHWINLDKALKKQLDKHAHIPRLYFGVMFYISTAHRIDDNRARYNYFLQLKSDVLDSRISCSSEQAIRLAAYYLQAELGHHDSEQHTVEMFRDVQILPKHMTKDDSITTDLLQDVLFLHNSLIGLHPMVAVIHYIKLAQTLDGYGMEYYTAKDDSGKELYLGTSNNGIFARYLNGQQALSFRWSVVAHIGQNKKCVIIDTQKTSIQYYLEDTEMAKYFQQIACLLQKFYKSFKPNSCSLTDLSDMGSISSAQDFQVAPTNLPLDSVDPADPNTALYSHSPNYAMDMQPGVTKENFCNTQPGVDSFAPDVVAQHYVNQTSDPSQVANNVSYPTQISAPAHVSQQQDLTYRQAMLPAYRPSPDYNQLMRQRIDNSLQINTSSSSQQSQPVYTTAITTPVVLPQQVVTTLTSYTDNIPHYANIIQQDSRYVDYQSNSWYNNFIVKPTHSSPELNTVATQGMPGRDYIAEDFMHDKVYYKPPPPPPSPPPPYPRVSSSTPDLAAQTVQMNINYSPDLVSRKNLGPISFAVQSKLDKSLENLAAAVNEVSVSDADSLCSCNSNQTGCSTKDTDKDFEDQQIPSEIEKNNIHVRYIAPEEAPPPSKSKEVATLRESFRRMMIARSSPACLGRFKEKAKKSRQDQIREDDDDDVIDDDDDVITNVKNDERCESASSNSSSLLQQNKDSDGEAAVVVPAGQAVAESVQTNKTELTTDRGTELQNNENHDDDVMKHQNIGPLKMAAMNGLTLSRPIILSASEDEIRAPKDERRKMLEGKVSEGCVLAEFEQIAKKAPNMECSIGQKPENESKNRFPDVLPYDETRVELSVTKNNVHGYINASHMKVNLGVLEWSFIATQAPLENTAQDFWQMIWEQEIDVIAMLTGIKEQGKQKCYPYWPQEPGSDHKLRFGRYEIELQFSNNSWCYFTNRISIKERSTGTERLVWHLQYTDWPDHGCPEDTYGFLGYLDEVESVQRLAESEEGSGKKSPIVVHCSAGVGRTGVVLLSIIMKSCLEHNLNVDIPLVLARLRQQRMYTVQTLGQYSFVYKTLIRYLKNTRLI